MNPRFHIGQKVVALKTFRATNGKTGIVKGQVYPVLDLRSSKCRCREWEVYVGVDEYGFMQCVNCGFTSREPEYQWWFSESHFAPIDELDEKLQNIFDEALSEIEQGELIAI